MELHSQARSVVEAIGKMNLGPLEALTTEQARAQFKQSRAPFLAPPQEVALAIDEEVPSAAGPIRVRRYRPLSSAARDQLPALIYFHGGGWVFGDLDTHDALCRGICNASGWCVVAVDYRRAPEHKFPAAAEDALAVAQFLLRHGEERGIDAARLAAGGDSAGGNLTAVTALALRARGEGQLKLQVLIYPVTDFAMNTPSYARLGQGFLLTSERMRFFKRSYLPAEADVADWRASPLRAPDLRGLPPALVMTASHDPLIDEGKAYADRLAEAGVTVTYKCYPGMVHGFLMMGGAIDMAQEGIKDIAAALKLVGA